MFHFHPFPRHSSPKAKTVFFSKKKSRVSQTVGGNTRNVFTRRGEGQPTCVTLVKGLPYISIRTGDQWSLEKYPHGRESRVEGWHKNLPALWIHLLVEVVPPLGGLGIRMLTLDTKTSLYSEDRVLQVPMVLEHDYIPHTYDPHTYHIHTKFWGLNFVTHCLTPLLGRFTY